jgi:ribonuclease HI
MACKFALEAAEVQGISRIELETDSSLLKEALATNSRDLAPQGVLFRRSSLTILDVSLSEILHVHVIQ